MGETFYSVLGVDRDATPAQIRAAYRDRVKESHPDLNDSTDAPRTFKRLTTARDVLLDADERATYDSLGHRTYVSRHLQSDVWRTADGPADVASAPDTGAPPDHATATGDWRRHARTRHAGPAAGGRPGGTSGEVRDNVTGSRTDGGSQEAWQRAPHAYRSSGTYPDDDRRSAWRSVLGGVRQLGSWVLLHLLVLLSAVLTAWLLVGSISADPAVSAAAGLLVVLLIGTVLIASMLHLLVELY